jgi:hypothetical protein
LVILPYRGETHSLTVWEAIDNYCLPLAFETGGVPEIIPQEFWPLCMTKPTPESLADKIIEQIQISATERAEKISSLRARCLTQQTGINQDLLKYFNQICEANTRPRDSSGQEVTVTVYITADSIPYFEETVLGLNHQSLAPREILFVFSGVDQEIIRGCQEQILSQLKCPYHCWVSESGLGWGGALKAGTVRATTSYIACMVPQQVLFPSALEICVHALEHHKQYAAVTGYTELLDQHKYSPALSEDPLPTIRRPRGGSPIIASQIDLECENSLVIFRKSDLEQIVAWEQESDMDTTTQSILIKMYFNQRRLMVIPQVISLYLRALEILNKKRLRTFQDQQVLAKSNLGLPRFEALQCGYMHVCRNTIKRSWTEIICGMSASGCWQKSQT